MQTDDSQMDGGNPDELLQMFQSMGTNDRDSLIKRFQSIVNNQDYNSSKFFLEANNWNLETAVSSYFESGNIQTYAQQRNPPDMDLLKDNTIHNKEAMLPGSTFRQSWILKNSGDQLWPATSCLVPVGNRMEGSMPIELPLLPPQEQCEAGIILRVPNQVGTFVYQWRMYCNEGLELYFGEQIYVVINVIDGKEVQDEVEKQRLSIHEAQNLAALESHFSNL